MRLHVVLLKIVRRPHKSRLGNRLGSRHPKTGAVLVLEDDDSRPIAHLDITSTLVRSVRQAWDSHLEGWPRKPALRGV